MHTKFQGKRSSHDTLTDGNVSADKGIRVWLYITILSTAFLHCVYLRVIRKTIIIRVSTPNMRAILLTSFGFTVLADKLWSRNFPHLIIPLRADAPFTPQGTAKSFEVSKEVSDLHAQCLNYRD